MPDFTYRSQQAELLDDLSLPFEDIKLNMQELNRINTLLGGHNVTLAGFRQLLGGRKSISVCEIGSGGGDNMNVIFDYCKKNNITVSLTGIDVNPSCVRYAVERYGNKAGFICSDFKRAHFDKKPDIIFSALFCHHFKDEEIVNMLEWMQQNSKLGFFVNDLERNFFAFHSIKILTRMFSKSRLVKNDAPLSVLRGFTSKEWASFLQKAEIPHGKVSWQWAFRYLITVEHGRQK